MKVELVPSAVGGGTAAASAAGRLGCYAPREMANVARAIAIAEKRFKPEEGDRGLADARRAFFAALEAALLADGARRL
ncbi:MAG: hypothetical protein ACO4B3_02175, partial [Planctomycetota bacterium]